MGGTVLKRKAQRNKVKAKVRIADIKRLTTKPVLRNIDIEQIKAEFADKAKAAEEAARTKATKKTTEAAEVTPAVENIPDEVKPVILEKTAEPEVAKTAKAPKKPKAKADDDASAPVAAKKKTPKGKA